jgi:hypothetical protein
MQAEEKHLGMNNAEFNTKQVSGFSIPLPFHQCEHLRLILELI